MSAQPIPVPEEWERGDFCLVHGRGNFGYCEAEESFWNRYGEPPFDFTALAALKRARKRGHG